MALFRSEVREYRAGRLSGEVQMAMPVSWQIIGALFFVIVLGSVLFVSLARYSRIETVLGTLSPEGGVAQILPTRAGTVSELSVIAGQRVARGAPLAIVRTGESLTSGSESAAEILTSLEIQDVELRRQEQQLSTAAVAGRALLESRISGLKLTISGLRKRIAVQQRMTESAREEVERAQGIFERGFISRRDLLQREELHLARLQQLSELEEALATQQAMINETRESMRQTNASAQAQIAAVSGQRSDLSQVRTNVELSSAYRLEAPVAGTVTALTARLGQAVSPQAPMMSIVPIGSVLQAELFVPASAIGFMEVGQTVSLALDAFPYQRFGTVPSQITSIASAPIMQNDGRGNTLPVYLVTAALKRNQIYAYGNSRGLMVGMTLTARIVTEDQSIVGWLFEPLFAVGRR